MFDWLEEMYWDYEHFSTLKKIIWRNYTTKHWYDRSMPEDDNSYFLNNIIKATSNNSTNKVNNTKQTISF